MPLLSPARLLALALVLLSCVGCVAPLPVAELSQDQREALRELDHPIIARVDHGDSSAGETTVLDLRTIHPDDDEVVAGALRSLPSAT